MRIKLSKQLKRIVVGVLVIALMTVIIVTRNASNKDNATVNSTTSVQKNKQLDPLGRPISDSTGEQTGPQGSTDDGSKPTSSTATTNSYVPNSLTGCPASYMTAVKQGKNPPAEIKDGPGITITIPNSSGTLNDNGTATFTSPDGVYITSMIVNDNGYAQQDPVIISGYNTRTITIRAWRSMNPIDITLVSPCIKYVTTIDFYFPPPPVVTITNLSVNEALDTVYWTADHAVNELFVGYTILGCDYSAPPNTCGSMPMPIPASGASGALDLNPLFPEIDQYFATYSASGIQLSISARAPGYQVGEYKSIIFSW